MFKFLTISGLRLLIRIRNFFFKKVNASSFREFHGLLESKNGNKYFKPYWSYIDFGKVLKKTEKSKYLWKY
jgi:hypothetical protein